MVAAEVHPYATGSTMEIGQFQLETIWRPLMMVVIDDDCDGDDDVAGGDDDVCKLQ